MEKTINTPSNSRRLDTPFCLRLSTQFHDFPYKARADSKIYTRPSTRTAISINLMNSNDDIHDDNQYCGLHVSSPLDVNMGGFLPT